MAICFWRVSSTIRAAGAGTAVRRSARYYGRAGAATGPAFGVSTPEDLADLAERIAEAERGPESVVLRRLVLALPAEIADEDERRAFVEEFVAENFGAHEWCAWIHVPDPTGDARNYHAHILLSDRPGPRGLLCSDRPLPRKDRRLWRRDHLLAVRRNLLAQLRKRGFAVHRSVIPARHYGPGLWRRIGRRGVPLLVGLPVRVALAVLRGVPYHRRRRFIALWKAQPTGEERKAKRRTRSRLRNLVRRRRGRLLLRALTLADLLGAGDIARLARAIEIEMERTRRRTRSRERSL